MVLAFQLTVRPTLLHFAKGALRPRSYAPLYYWTGFLLSVLTVAVVGITLKPMPAVPHPYQVQSQMDQYQNMIGSHNLMQLDSPQFSCLELVNAVN